tara:strand:- start:402 stop:674 length:273 start_codon:yes stop_codon:yes gene_type:complete
MQALLLADSFANWTPEGAMAIAEMLEELEGATGEPMEFNRIDLRCQFNEYGFIEELEEIYDIPEDEDPIDWLMDRTIVHIFEGGLIVGEF